MKVLIIEDDVVMKKGSYAREGITIGKGAVIEENTFLMKDLILK